MKNWKRRANDSLEQRLQRLGQELEYPPEPDVTQAVLLRLDRRPFPWRVVAVALAVLAVAVGAVFAVRRRARRS